LPQGRTLFLGTATLEDAADLIRRALGGASEGIGITFLGNRSGEATFRGAVNHAGSIGMPAPRSLADILKIAEPTEFADLNGIIVIAAEGNVFRVDSEVQPKFSIRGGDQILVPQLSQANEVLILGGVAKPGSFKFMPGETLEKLVDRAGGITGHGVPTELTLVRGSDLVKEAAWTEAGKKTILKRGDIVRIPLVENGRYITVLGYVKTPGLVPFKAGMTLMEALEAAGGTTVGAGLGQVEVRKVFGGLGGNKKFDVSTLRKRSARDPQLQAADVVFVPAFVFSQTGIKSGFRPVVPPRGAR